MKMRSMRKSKRLGSRLLIHAVYGVKVPYPLISRNVFIPPQYELFCCTTVRLGPFEQRNQDVFRCLTTVVSTVARRYAFENALNQYMKENCVVFVRTSSNQSTNAVLRYEWVYYKCSRRPPRPTESQGIQRSELTKDEFGSRRAPLNYGTPSCEMRQFVADEFGKILTTQDIYNYRRKCRPAVLSRYRIVGFYCGTGYAFGAGKTSGDGTRACVALYTILLTDGMSIGRPVMYAFVKSEQFAPMRKLFILFKEMMGEHYPVRTFVMDKLAAPMRAAKVVFGCDPTHIPPHGLPGQRRTVVFLFIVLQTHRFRQDLQLLRRTDLRFVSYLTVRCFYITQKWAIHARSGMVHFGNVTNNRLENANGRLKDRVHRADTLEHSIKKVSRNAEWLVREFEMHTPYHCERRQILADYGYVLNVVCRTTTYAYSLVLRHLGPQPPRLPYDSVGINKARLWFKLPDPPKQLTPVLENAHARSTKRCGCRTYICFLFLRSICSKYLLPNPPTMAVGLQPAGKRAQILQLMACRLWSKILHLNPDGGLGTQTWAFVRSVTGQLLPATRCARCATDRVTYHVDCCYGGPCPLCSDALQACPKASGPSKNANVCLLPSP
ncbi:hypothetical protein CSKR_106612 [Clonorchis sinensis]|uniref:MULE transposase domain-containing protein n=1 Tax=Clonorchis sinensis TaxID=79923 RepID=A0A3R7DBT5_CLOSI|nr:hypothetical protein CSKR_106612 [Clonorchis sinensis]